LAALAVALVSGVPASAHESHAAAAGLLIPSAGWHGRPIKNPHHHKTIRTAAAATPLPGWSAGPVSFGAGYHRPGGSDRVREVQRRLTRLGYHTGPIDGLFGPLTRASVGWFQVKHGLPVNGRATLATVRHLRATSGRAGGGTSTQLVTTRPSERRAEPARTARAERASTPLVTTRPADGPSSAPAWVAGSAVALLALMLAATALPRRHESKPVRSAAAQPHARALAYVLIPPGEPDEARFRSQAAAIESECAARGLAVVGMVVDVEDSRLIWQRPGLATAVRRLVDGEVDFLMVTKVEDASGADLKRLVEATNGEIAIARWQRESRIESRHERELSNA
jgi:hypothetical protein